jgi:ubiquitin-like protein ATG12
MSETCLQCVAVVKMDDDDVGQRSNEAQRRPGNEGGDCESDGGGGGENKFNSGTDLATRQQNGLVSAVKIDNTRGDDDLSPSSPIIESMDKDRLDLSKKVKVHFVAVGSAPIMKRTKFQMPAHLRFAAVQSFLQKLLFPVPSSQVSSAFSSGSPSLFIYIQSAFVPGPDEVIGELRDAFGIRDELIIHYSLQEAWG